MLDQQRYERCSNVTVPWLVLFQCTASIFILYFEAKVAKPAFARGGGDAMFGLATTMMLGLVLNILWRNAIVDFICSPLTNLLTGGNEVSEKRPLYAGVISKRNRGEYGEASAEARKLVDEFPEDLEGVLLLAAIEAENRKDLQAAEITVNQFCDRPTAAPSEIAIALTQLADWHLKSADTAAASAVFQKIMDRFPSTKAAARAEQRLAQLGETAKTILAHRDCQRIMVPEGVRNIGLLESSSFLQPKAADPESLAETYIQHLAAHPHDLVAREKLATLYARDFKRLDLAEFELGQLINEAHHQPKQVAHWLNLLANFQIELGAEEATVRQTLEKIVERFNTLPVAKIAQRRLALLNNEFRGRQTSRMVKLGVYEQNIGLKCGLPARH